jgi:hypothetical protein
LVRRYSHSTGAYGEAADHVTDEITPPPIRARARGAEGHYSRRAASAPAAASSNASSRQPQPELQGQMTFGSSLAADLMLIWVFVVVDVAIPFDDDFALLAVLA